MRFIPTAISRSTKGPVHLRANSSQLRTLCGRPTAHDTVHDRASMVCDRCTEAARFIVGRRS